MRIYKISATTYLAKSGFLLGALSRQHNDSCPYSRRRVRIRTTIFLPQSALSKGWDLKSPPTPVAIVLGLERHRSFFWNYGFQKFECYDSAARSVCRRALERRCWRVFIAADGSSQYWEINLSPDEPGGVACLMMSGCEMPSGLWKNRR